MKSPTPRRIFLRASIPRLRLTEVRNAGTPDAEGEVQIGPRVCWAAGLAEFEQVEVHNLTRGARFLRHVRFGRERELSITPTAGSPMQPGDVMRISAYVWLPETAVGKHIAIFIQVDEDNNVTEFHEVAAREVPLDPSSFPLPPPCVIGGAVTPAGPSGVPR